MDIEDASLTRYYISQAGSGIGELYAGPIYQKGYGLGSFLGGLFRGVLPILKKGGTNVINDIQNNISPREAIKARGREALQKMAQKAMFGDGFKYTSLPKKRQLSGIVGQVKTNKKRKTVKKKKTVKKTKKKSAVKKKTKKKKNTSRDIFSF